MVPGYQILFIFVSMLVLNTKLLMASSGSSVWNAEGPTLQERYWMENNEDGKEKEVQMVSGEDGGDEKRSLIIEKFRFLLGLKSFHIKNLHGHIHGEVLSPAPAPIYEVEAPAPAPTPTPVVHKHVHSHHPLPRSKLSPPPLHHHQVHRHQNKDGHRRKIIIAVSSGVASAITTLGLVLFCWKFRRSRKRKSTVKVSVSVTDDEEGRSRYASPSHSKPKGNLDLGPDNFYLNSLRPSLEPDTSYLKYASGNANTLSKQNQMVTSFLENHEIGREAIPSQTESVGCSLVEEIVSTNGAETPNVCETQERNNCLIVNTNATEEPLSSDDESFHSVCDSNSSDGRISDASDGDLSNLSEICSPLSCINKSTPNHSVPPLRQSPSTNTPTPAVTSNTPYPVDQHSSKQLMTPMSPLISPQHVPFPLPLRPPQPPPPPPPPPPPANHFPSKSSLHSMHGKSAASKPPILNTSSSQNTSSPGSNPSQKVDSMTSPPHKPTQASISTPQGTPSPPCPPIPPPFFKASSNSSQAPPPPPPGQMLQFVPVGKDGAPLPKLKPLHWDKVRAASDRSTIWDKLGSSSFELDEEMIESLFRYNTQTKNDEAKSKSPSPTKHILEPKRLQNITILSKALNATPEQVCDALRKGEGLCLQQLEALVKMVPTKEEEAKLSTYQGNSNELDPAEKFVQAMLNVSFAFIRVEAMLYRDTFEDEVIHLRKSFAMLEEACKELRSSQLFLKLLEAVLKTGNRMNVGTIRGGARAFKLDALLKLADVKGTDGKTTLLHFVVQEMIRSEGIRESDFITKQINLKTKKMSPEEREEDYRRLGLDLVSGLCTELNNVKKTATVDLDVIASSVSNLSDGMFRLQHLVQDDLSMDQNSKFVQSMQAFLNYADKNIKELKKDEDRVLLHVKEITEYFHGHVSKDEVNPLRIFVIVRDFLGMLDQVCKEIRTLKVTHSPNSIAPFR